MIDKSLRVLEYDKIIAMLKERAESQAGKDKCDQLRPSTSLKQIRKRQDETKEGLDLLRELGRPPLFGIYDLREALVYAEKSGTLSARSLLEISSSLRTCSELKSYIADKEEDGESPNITDMVDRLNPMKNLQEEIDRTIISEDEIADNASSKLMNIRKSLGKNNDQVREKINSIVSSNSSYLQDNIATVRDGRHVVPVKSQYRNTFKGIVHDRSASGQTVYIEPMAVVDLNNEIKILEEEEREEIQRILKKLSERVARNSVEIGANQNILIDLDFVFARAKLAKDMDGVYPKLNDQAYIKLVNARHPLLEEDVVPISLELGDDFTSLLITGPNTGGKTVSLKTVGLLTLMGQSGLHLPADKGTEIGVFDSVFADIGDEQSIEQSLSTFSSHMVNIVDILDQLSPNSLVILDELGAGTDPTEGSALAIAILDYLLDRKIRTIATTHYAELKIYALNTDGVENASVEFDVESLRPTYKLRLGSVGKSNAFDISKRLGVPDEIIEYASGLISTENKSFEDALVKIDEDRKTIEDVKVQIKDKEEDAKKIQARLNIELEDIKNKKADIIKQAQIEASEIVNNAREEARESIRELNKIKESASDQSVKRAHEIKRDLDDRQKDYKTEDYDFLNVKSDEKVEDLKLGDELEVLSLGQTGQLMELPNSNGDIVVEIGILKINTNIDQVRRAESREKQESQSSVKNIIKDRVSRNIDMEIDLRGKNIEEARSELDIYIDDAFLAGLKEIRIIHGKGTGVLRKAIQEYVKNHKLLTDFRLGDHGEGGSGVTIAKLKQ